MGADPKQALAAAESPDNWWERFRERLRALKPCRVPIILVAAGLAFLVLADQGEDVARALAERPGNDDPSSQAPWYLSLQGKFFFAASLAWAVSAWYWARVMLYLRLPGTNPGELGQWLRTWVPRLLGFFATLGVAWAFYKAARGYDFEEYKDVRELLEFYALWCVIGAFAFLIAVSARRTLFKLPKAKVQSYGTLGLRELGLWTRMLLIGAIAAAFILFVLMIVAVQTVAPALGSATIILLAAAGWIAVGSTLDYLGMRWHVPVFTALLLLAVGSSWRNDNHAVRTLPQAQATHPTLHEYLEAWIGRHDAAIKRGGTVPIFLVNAEGGGIRAAYWTVTVLGTIQERHPAFASHVFSLSGVSGGSLGSSVFLALLAESREGAPQPKLMEKGQRILGKDFLSPVVGAMLYPDLLQRILPFPVHAFDRAVTLEESWERAWEQVMRTKRMSEPFDKLWAGRSEWTPALILNATWVETGKRIIASNLKVAATPTSDDFVDVEDAHVFFAPRSLPLSTAAHLSARFTYVSPAGSLQKDGKIYGRAVDGGYFENSGATATLAILQTIGQLAETDPRWKQVEPYVIHISNDPVDVRYANDSLATAPDNPNIAPKHALNEVLSPLLALLHTRDARGYYSRESAAWAVGYSHFFHFGLCRRSANAPLGWALSKSARSRMDSEVDGQPCVAGSGDKKIVVFDNKTNLQTIAALFPATAPTKGPELPVVERSPGKSTPEVRTGTR